MVAGERGVPMAPLRAMLAGQVVLHGASFVAAVYATVLLATQRAGFPRAFRLQLIVFALVPVGELALYWTIRNVFEGRAALAEVPIAKVFVYLAIAAALALYVRHSERVCNTFVR
jgi:hypothetical protein